MITCMALPVLGEDINNLPMYGGREKTPEKKKSDMVFIEAAIKEYGNRQKACDQYVKLGWQYFAKGDYNTAMKRFNQAWLLDQKNGGIYWGLGAATSKAQMFDESIKMFKTASSHDPQNPRLMVDFGHAYIGKAEKNAKNAKERVSYNTLATDLFKKAVAIDPKLEPAYFNWSVALYNLGDYKQAWQRLDQAKQLGGKSIDPDFLQELKTKMPDPATK